MSDPRPPELDRMRRYLLGQLGEPDGQAIEDRILGGAELFAALEEAEDDLIEDYLEGALAGDDRTHFEGYFLASPRRQQSLVCAEMLRIRHFQQLEVAERPPAPGARGWLVAAALLVAALVLAKHWGTERPSSSPQRTVLAPSTLAPALVPPHTPEPPPPRPVRPTQVARLTLFGDPRLLLLAASEVGEIEILLEGAEANAEVAAQLLSAQGVVSEWKQPKPASILRFRAPRACLASGDYRLCLTGRTSGGTSEELMCREITVERQ